MARIIFELKSSNPASALFLFCFGESENGLGRLWMPSKGKSCWIYHQSDSGFVVKADAFLQKPFTIEKITKTVFEVLSHRNREIPARHGTHCRCFD